MRTPSGSAQQDEQQTICPLHGSYWLHSARGRSDQRVTTHNSNPFLLTEQIVSLIPQRSRLHFVTT